MVLEGDTVDHPDDVGDPGTRLLDGAHRHHNLVDDAAPLFGDALRLARQVVGAPRVVGILMHSAGQLFHARPSVLFQTGRLLFGATGEILVALGNLAGRGVDRIGGFLDREDDFAKTIDGAVGVVAHLA